jgi:uncharacterized tellurite resistance protein B-like protein
MNRNAFIQAAAIILWADEKVEPEELVAAKAFFEKYGIDWGTAEAELQKEIGELLDPGEEGEEESETELVLNVIDFGTGIDQMEVFKELCFLACADNQLDWIEVDILHRLAEAMNIQKEVVTASLAAVVAQTKCAVNV